MKYIVLRVYGEMCDTEYPIIFSSNLVHADVADAVKAIEMLRGSEVVSAGEVSLIDVRGCGGKSETCNVKSRGEEDDRLISLCDYGAMFT